MGAPAIGAAVIEELDQRHIAFGVATDPGIIVVENGLGIGRDKGRVGAGLILILAFFQNGDRFHQNLGVFQKIGADFLLENIPFFIIHVGQTVGQGRADPAKGDQYRQQSFHVWPLFGEGFGGACDVLCLQPAG